jgi:hypothetical protein
LNREPMVLMASSVTNKVILVIESARGYRK